MKQIANIFKFELMNKFKSKPFMIAWLVMVLVVIGIILIPSIIFKMNFKSDSTYQDRQLILVGKVSEDLKKTLKNHNYDLVIKNSLDEIVEDTKGQVIEVINPFEYNFYDFKDSNLSTILNDYYLVNIKIQELGISLKQYQTLKNTSVIINHKSLNHNGINNKDTRVFIGMLGVFILYFSSLIFGSSLGMNVVREKESRVMEILITSTNAKNLILGKVLSNIFLSLLEISSLILTAFITIKLTSFYNEGGDIILNFISQNISLDMIVVFFIYFILGTSLYYFLIGATASLVSKIEEYSSAVSLVTILIIAGFMISQFSVNAPNSLIIKIASYVPFFSPFVMMIRYAVGSVSLLELMINVGILTIFTSIIIVLTIKIYRYGTINYGNKFKFLSMIKTKWY